MKALRRMSVLAKAACHGEEMRVQTSVIPSLHLNVGTCVHHQTLLGFGRL